MLPRRQSIFHLGEEGGAAVVHHHRVGVVGAAAMAGANGRRERLVVGLQILVHQHHHHHHHHHNHSSHGRHGHAANIVLKQVVRPRSASAASRHGAASSSFLKACSLCRRALSPSKDVYMYRRRRSWMHLLVRSLRAEETRASAVRSAGGSRSWWTRRASARRRRRSAARSGSGEARLTTTAPTARPTGAGRRRGRHLP